LRGKDGEFRPSSRVPAPLRPGGMSRVQGLVCECCNGVLKFDAPRALLVDKRHTIG
jgi:hypothetical protein